MKNVVRFKKIHECEIISRYTLTEAMDFSDRQLKMIINMFATAIRKKARGYTILNVMCIDIASPGSKHVNNNSRKLDEFFPQRHFFFVKEINFF